MDSLRMLYIFGDSEQRAKAQKAIDDIWAGRNGWFLSNETTPLPK